MEARGESGHIAFFPGLGSNHRLFRPQLGYFKNSVVAKYVEPLSNETLEAYCARWANSLEFTQPFFLAGVSFGGMVALELSRHLPAAGVFLIASCRSKSAIEERFRIQEKIGRNAPDGLTKAFLENIGAPLFVKREGLSDVDEANIKAMVSEIDLPFFRWSSRAAAEWEFNGDMSELNCPVFQVHGNDDWVISYRDGDVIEGGKHLINLTHADRVNQFLEEKVKEVLSSHVE